MNKTLLEDLSFGFVDNSTTSAKKHHPRLIRNDEAGTMLQAIHDELATANSFVFSVAFIAPAALAMLKEKLLQFRGKKTIITSNYLDFNEPAMFKELMQLQDVEVFIYPDDDHGGFHPKGYIFEHDLGVSAIVGSSNLTRRALQENEEWNLLFSADSKGDIAYQLQAAVKMQKERCIPLTEEWIAEYEQNRVPPRSKYSRTSLLPSGPIVANKMQRVALSNIADLRQTGERKGLLISATGTGKTILAALAVKEAQPNRVLFVAHREQILSKACREFQKVLGTDPSEFGLLVGGKKDAQAKYLFASVQSLHSGNTFKNFAHDAFDFIIIDEVHRGAAATYGPLFKYFESQFLLGLTATPERPDSADVFSLFDFNVPYEIRLQDALRADMLAPFHYFGVTEYSDGNEEIGDNTASINALVDSDRIDYMLEKLRVYGFPEAVKGLIFCSRKDEARELSAKLNKRELFGKTLRTKTLVGENSIAERDAVISELEEGKLDYIITVDVFNEGIDIPSVNQIVMLRGTQSNIIFTQQLGRGLRKAVGKDHLRVIDFIGNYKNNYLIPIALFGDSSRSKTNIKEKVVDPPVPNGSSVNFDEIARERILSSINTASLDTIAEFKKDIQLLEYRLNAVPKLMDFARFGNVDPEVISTRRTANYWELLYRIKKADRKPSEVENDLLKFLSRELLPGKQPQELLLLKTLIREGTVSRDDYIDLLEEKQTAHSDLDISVVERVLKREFYPKKTYETSPLINFDENEQTYSLSTEFLSLYNNWEDSYPNSFREHVDDIIETGLFLSRERGFASGVLRRNHNYSRKDVSRLLGLQSDQTGTLNGYKIDNYSGSIPIFVNYRKHRGTPAGIDYKDEFLDHHTMQWYTRRNRTLNSAEVKSIVNHKYPIHLFVRRDDLTGEGFRYLGEVSPSDARNTTMKDADGKEVDVVAMNLNLEHPVPDTYFEYLHAKSSPNL